MTTSNRRSLHFLYLYYLLTITPEEMKYDFVDWGWDHEAPYTAVRKVCLGIQVAPNLFFSGKMIAHMERHPMQAALFSSKSFWFMVLYMRELIIIAEECWEEKINNCREFTSKAHLAVCGYKPSSMLHFLTPKKKTTSWYFLLWLVSPMAVMWCVHMWFPFRLKCAPNFQ